MGCVAASAEFWRLLHPQMPITRGRKEAIAHREAHLERRNAGLCTVDLYAPDRSGSFLGNAEAAAQAVP
jgi:hypothetical protein